MSFRLHLDLAVPCDTFEVAIAWETSEPALGLFGPSGAGKSSLLEALAGLRPGARGRIEVGGRTWLDSRRGFSLPPEERGVGYVPQELALFPHRDVLAHLRFGAGRARRLAASARRLAPERVLELLELGALADRPVTALSGGERQRVALGRALCSGPELLLLDEPLASLDLALRRRILPYLLRVRDELGIPTVHVSHEPSEPALLCREVCMLSRGRGVAGGPPAEVFGPHPLAAGEGGAGLVNVLSGSVLTLAESLATFVVVRRPPRSTLFPCASLFRSLLPYLLRASDILLARGAISGLSAQNVLPATVCAVHLPQHDEPHAAAVVSASLAGVERPLAVVVSRRACRELELVPGVAVHLIFKAQACRLLAAY